MSQTVQKAASTPPSLLARQGGLRRERFLGTLFVGGIRILSVSSRCATECGRDELEYCHVRGCDGVIYGLLLFQREESLRRASGIREEDAVNVCCFGVTSRA